MRLSHWRQVKLFEAALLSGFLAASVLVLILPVSLDILIRLSFAVAFVMGDIPVFFEVDSRARAREWHDFRRPTAAYFLGFGLALMAMRYRAQDLDPFKYQQKVKGLLLVMGLADPTLLALVDDLGSAKAEANARDPYNAIRNRLWYLLTPREANYLEFWWQFSMWVLFTGTESGTAFHGSPSAAAQALAGPMEPGWRRLQESVLFLDEERNPFIPPVYHVLATQIRGAKHLWLPNTQYRLLAETLEANQGELDRIWAQLVTGEP